MATNPSLCPETVSKTVGRKILVDFEFAAQMASGETLNSPSLSFSSGGLTAGAPSISGSRIQALYASGTTGIIYEVTCEADTSLNQHLDAVGILEVT
jgi:hypothetical protein